MNTLIQAVLMTIPACYVVLKLDKIFAKRHKAYNPPQTHDQREEIYD